MAFLRNHSTISSHFRSHSQKHLDSISRRGLHVEPGPREKALLGEDPALKRFMSHKWSFQRDKAPSLSQVLRTSVLAGLGCIICAQEEKRMKARKNAGESA